MPLFEAVKYRFPIDSRCVDVRVAYVGGDMIRTGLKRKPVAFLKRQIDKSFGPPTPDGIFFAVRAWRIGHLVVLAVALVDLDRRLNGTAIIAPVSAHRCSTRVRSGDSVEELQIGIKHLGIGRVYHLIGARDGEA